MQIPLIRQKEVIHFLQNGFFHNFMTSRQS